MIISIRNKTRTKIVAVESCFLFSNTAVCMKSAALMTKSMLCTRHYYEILSICCSYINLFKVYIIF